MLDPESEHSTDIKEAYRNIVLTQGHREATGRCLFVSRLVTENADKALGERVLDRFARVSGQGVV